MALKIISCKTDNWDNFLNVIHENTNIKVEATDTYQGGMRKHNITFPDGKKMEGAWLDIYFSSSEIGFYGDTMIVLVDESKDFIYTVTSGGSEPPLKPSGNSMGVNLVYYADDEPHNMRWSSGNYAPRDIFSLPGTLNRNDAMAEIYEMFPLVLYDGSIVPNMFYQTKKQFAPGLKFIDGAGNKWVTCGMYLLYHYE